MKSIKDHFSHLLFVFAIALIIFPKLSYGQYFGKNKVQYEDREFKIYQTPHFDIYQYLDNEEVLDALGKWSERWYLRHQAILADTFKQRNPVIMYNNKTDFKQTTILQRRVSIGLGGVTEGLRNRVAMPMTVSNSETNHVLGHEMVHAFQYHLAKTNDSINLRGLTQVPLWVIEGLAEYLSIGITDVHTAIWMRDAVASNNIPTFEDLEKNPQEYFPYRFGHAAWVFLTGIWGDGLVKPLQLASAKLGVRNALDSLLGYSSDTLSILWKRTLQDYYEPYMKDTIAPVGTLALEEDDRGEINIAPVLSPDGRYFTFISDRDVISIDVFLANAETGDVISKLSETVRRSHIDDYSYLESAGTWSPDGNRFALTTFVKGTNRLLIIDVDDVEGIRELQIPGVDAFQNPAWSPNGNHIVVTGLVNGVSDLYSFNIKTGDVMQLTNDRYSDLQPSWSPDGRYIAFTSDRGPKTDLSEDIFGKYQINVYDVENNQVRNLDIFVGANNINPQFSADGSKIYFLSNADGFRNLYEHNLETEQTFKLTKYYTGIIGITELTPVLSVSGPDDKIMYSLYKDGRYQMFKANASDFPRFQVDTDNVDLSAAQLPPANRRGLQIVADNLDEYPDVPVRKFEKEPYQARFQLVNIGSAGIGVGTNQFGSSYSGGVSFMFGDILNRHQLFASARIQGQIEDFGGQVAYLNQANRINWGVSLSHIPYRSSRVFLRDSVEVEFDGEDVLARDLVLQVIRTFENKANVFALYPLSANLRFELGASYSRYGYQIDSINNYYSPNGILFDRREFELDGPSANYIGNAYIAYVGDNSIFGLTSPLMGNRYRFQIERYFSDLRLWSFLADYRKYWYARPVSFAIRGMFYGRYGDTAEQLQALFLGNQYFVRGYTVNSFRNNNCQGDDCLELNQLVGRKMAVANAEIRFPFTGPERLALIKSGFLFSDLVLFGDAGLAWDDPSNIEFSLQPETEQRTPVFSAGVAWRVNLFGYVVVEPYLAIPFQRKGVETVFSLYLLPGGW